MTKLSEVNVNASKKVLVYGNSGGGKTCFAMSFPGPIYVADFDNKISSAASFYSDDKEKLASIDFDAYFPSGADSVASGAKVFNEWCLKLNELEKLAASGDFPYETIVVDSLTLYSDRMMDAVMHANPGVKRNAKNVPALQDYGMMTPHFKQQLNRVLALPCNVVMTAHIKIDKDELTGQIVRGPNLSPKLAAYLPILFYEVYHAYAETKGNETVYLAQTKSDYAYNCRSQISGLPAKIPLTYKSLLVE